MIVTCLDSSALLRVCLGEGDVAPVEAALRNTAAVSILASVEMPCAIWARFHRGIVDAAERDRLLAATGYLLESTCQLGLTAAVRREAVAIAGRSLLRALDALHLGTAVVASRQQRRRGGQVRFCTADVRQGEAAAACLGAGQVDLLSSL